MNTETPKIKKLTVAALFAAIIFIGTAFLKIPLPIGQEYIHLGDGFIFIAAIVLSTPYALAASAIGASLADIIGGYAIWAPWTVVIKALMALTISLLCNSKHKVKFRTAYAMTIATLINTAGYYLAGIIIYQNAYTGLPAIPFTVIQSLSAVVVFFLARNVIKNLVAKY